LEEVEPELPELPAGGGFPTFPVDAVFFAAFFATFFVAFFAVEAEALVVDVLVLDVLFIVFILTTT
jgi:hypothetical protein